MLQGESGERLNNYDTFLAPMTCNVFTTKASVNHSIELPYAPHLHLYQTNSSHQMQSK